MARFLAKIPSSGSIQATFDYLADFSTCAQWDPSVSRAVRTSAGAIEEGSTFEVTVSFFGTQSTLDYTIVDYERPHRVVLIGETATVLSYDEITFVPSTRGCQVVYDARLSLKTPAVLRPFGPIADLCLGALFRLSGARSAEGLERALARP